MSMLDLWQFRISEKPEDGSIKVGRFFIHLGPEVNATEVKSDHGTCLGYLIGSPIDLREVCLAKQSLEVEVENQPEFEDILQKVLSRVGGNFLWVSLLKDRVRIVPDAMTQVGLVYDAKRQVAGSTPASILDDAEYQGLFNKELYNTLDVAKEGWFPAGLTSHRGVKRLLPHHYLDLDSWTVHRFGFATSTDPISPQEASNEIAGIIEIQLRSLMKEKKRLAVTLTAGLDSRVVLACCRDFLNDIDFMTLQTSGMRSVDAIVAGNISKRYNLNQIELPLVTSTDLQRDLFIKRGGHCVADNNSMYHPSVWKISSTHNLAGGLGGEIGRAFMYQNGLPNLEKIDGRLVNSLLGLPASQDVIYALDEWLENAPKSTSEEVLDYVYYENRMGPWAMSQRYCDPTLERFSPMISYRSMELMLGLPFQWKLESSFEHHIINERWEELSTFPINSLGRWADKYYLIVEAFRNPHKVAKFFRKRIAKFG